MGSPKDEFFPSHPIQSQLAPFCKIGHGKVPRRRHRALFYHYFRATQILLACFRIHSIFCRALTIQVDIDTSRIEVKLLPDIEHFN